MKIYIGVTDNAWFKFLREKNAYDVNFWKPSVSPFKALKENELFLFKLHYPENMIAGGGFFLKYLTMPLFLAWSTFAENNGCPDYEYFKASIGKKKKNVDIHQNMDEIGCILLYGTFYFSDEDMIEAPNSFYRNTVSGKTYESEEGEGKVLFNKVMERLNESKADDASLFKEEARYGESLTKHRLGQASFRALVADAYHKRCAISGEKTLPVLQAAHIKPYSKDGPHLVNNGIFLRSDLHTLFDQGYITVDNDYRIDVSKRLFEDYGNGRDYYKYKGEKLIVIPDRETDSPSRDFLSWHNENIFLG